MKMGAARDKLFLGLAQMLAGYIGAFFSWVFVWQILSNRTNALQFFIARTNLWQMKGFSAF